MHEATHFASPAEKQHRAHLLGSSHEPGHATVPMQPTKYHNVDHALNVAAASREIRPTFSMEIDLT